MNTADLAEKIVTLVGGRENISEVLNCMTRVRVELADQDKADVTALMELEDVMGVVKDNPIQIVLGPGRAQKVGAELRDSLKDGYVKPIPLSVDKTWEANKAAHATHHSYNAVKDVFARVSGIFTPVIPAVIAAGLCSGIGSLIGQMQAADAGLLFYISELLTIIGRTFFTCFTIFTGIYAAKAFGASPALGGLLGAFILTPAFSTDPGSGGGILGVILGVMLLAQIEKFLKKYIPDSITLLITPFVSIILSGAVYIYLIMPATGWFSEILIRCLRFLTDSPYLVVRLIVGFALSAAFLPIVMEGYHHVFVILYALELQLMGDISLLPCLIMAGAGQIGASLAICNKADKVGNQRMGTIIRKALPAALFGIGEPLIYGVTLPMKKPFLTAGIGAGFGGALCLAAGVRMCAWGISGMAAIPLMKTPSMMLWFSVALLMSYSMGFVITSLFISKGAVRNG